MKLLIEDVKKAYQLAISENDSESTWFDLVISNIDKQLMKSPMSYRNYGPYWWNLKKILQKEFLNDQDCYEGDIEIMTADEYDYGEKGLNIIAALLYVNIVKVNDFENSEIHENGYIIEDMDMETCGMVGSFPGSSKKNSGKLDVPA